MRIPRPLLRITLACGTFVLTLAGAELGMRLGDLGPPPWPDMRGKLTRRADDPELRVELQPDAEQEIDYFDGRGGPPRTVRMRVNSAGLRGPLCALERRPGTLRIACLGDSFTYGWGVGEGESWPDQLRLRLSARAGTEVEVLNFGVPAYTTYQESIQLRAKVLPYRPDLVLLTYYANDIAIPRPRGQEADDRDWLTSWTHPQASRRMAWARAHSRLLDTLCDGIFRWRSREHLGWHKALDYGEGSPGWKRARESLLAMRDLLAERGIPFGVLLYPYLAREGAELSTHAVYATVTSFCRASAIHCFDAESVFLEQELPELVLSPHDYHPRPEAHALFAAAVDDWIAEQGWLEAGAR